MKKLGIIVDGAADLLSIKKRYPGKFKVLKTDGPRGHCSQVCDIISKSRKQVSMLKALNCKRAIILLDFECRKESITSFVKDLKTEIEKQDLPLITDIVVSNKMIENWYLADIEYLSQRKEYIKDRLKQKSYEGKHGKDELRKLFKRNYSYSETSHGPELFSMIRESIAKKNSISFKIFIEKTS
ncbi:hypothetical protein [Compostibacter hankyongensis]|uniref:DUF4276 family protein n=1 Tax=Compostibacter hankyongensis TaxID=1007089 RepID=A0ABP8G550_9BACT